MTLRPPVHLLLTAPDGMAFTARRIVAERTQRDVHFPGLDEPAFYVLIDLFLNRHADIDVTSACIASFAPPTTALRHLGELEQTGFVTRESDPLDGRRTFVRLTEAGERTIALFLKAAGEPHHGNTEQGRGW